jgi:predicted DNA-binding transcriptional regulator AlpA
VSKIKPKFKRPSALKADNEKRPQSLWLRGMTRRLPPLKDDPPPPERAGDQSPRLLDRHQVCTLTGTSYPTIWTWMRAGTFPRGRVVGGRSMWITSEIEAWLAALPVRPLKGDAGRGEAA